MTNKILDRVTITGADDNTNIDDMFRISEKYRWVEWGLLLSGSSQGKVRFPSMEWLKKLHMRVEGYKDQAIFPLPYPQIQICGHLCGKWVRDVCKGDWSFTKELELGSYEMWRLFNRYQLNFHAYLHKIKDKEAFVAGFKSVPNAKQFIFQLDNVNNEIVDVAREEGVDACPFFDLSGGVGRLPKKWDKAKEGIYTGYAGGLSPENVAEQLVAIEQVCGEGPIWIDVESHVRSPDNHSAHAPASRYLDMEKVEAFLEASKPWVIT